MVGIGTAVRLSKSGVSFSDRSDGDTVIGPGKLRHRLAQCFVFERNI